MIELATLQPINWTALIATSTVIFLGVFVAVAMGCGPFRQAILRQEAMFTRVLRGKLLIDVKSRSATYMSGISVLLFSLISYALVGWLGGLIGAAVGALFPYFMLKLLARRRLDKLEAQLVPGIQTLASGVRAGLNLVQAMELVAIEGMIPLRQEFRHLLREYEFGMSLEEAMDNAAVRIGSGDFTLLFAALQTHRERGGNLGETLDRIAESIREIQRLENRVKTLTAQGRATARWLGVMPIVVLLIIYFIVDAEGVKLLFTSAMGNVILFGIVVLTILGFLWIRKIVDVDI